MASLSRIIKKMLYSPASPDFLFAWYFQRLSAKNRNQLANKLAGGKDLMNHLNAEQQDYWQKRIDDVLAGPDNVNIPRHAAAGKLTKEQFVMHNGLLIDPLSYYNFPLLKMLVENKGVHEPQEEKIFREVLTSMEPAGRPCMLELGAYWSFYSMWFMQRFKNAQCFMVEPDRRNLFYGKENLKLNKMQGKFIHAGIGKSVDRAANITTVDKICAEQQIKFIDILHSDIQGFELEMLNGAEQTLSENKVGYVFVSTHSNELHYDCQKVLLEKYNFEEVASADLDDTYSWDGILVMKAPHYKGMAKVEIARKTVQA